MSPPVKRKRPYRSARRAEQAEDTRRRILRAAQVVFVARGYSGTTMVQVAAEAGTSVETVYAAFGTKAALLAQAVRAVLIVDGKSPVESPRAQAVRTASDPREALHIFARDITGLLAQVSPIFDVVARARAEPEIGALYVGMQQARLRNLRIMVGWIDDNGGLRAGLAADAAAETVWALASPELYRSLHELRGWAPERYAAWLAETLIAALLPRVRDRGAAGARPRLRSTRRSPDQRR